MKVYNKRNSNIGGGIGFKAYLLIGQSNTENKNISLQFTEVEINCEQPIHKHEPEQCYFIVEGEGLMTVGNETKEVKEGDAILISSNEIHGIKNIGSKMLKYITANSPAFGIEYEERLWDKEPEKQI